MNQFELQVLITTTAGVLITLGLAYIPGVQGKWEELDGPRKRLTLAILYLAVAAGLFVPSCLNWQLVVACSTDSIWTVVWAFWLALIASQGMYNFLPASTKERMSSAPEPVVEFTE